MKFAGTILFLLLFMELFFRIWDGHTRQVHQREKAGARLVLALLLILGLLIGILEGALRYGTLILLLGLQAGLAFLSVVRHNKHKGNDESDEGSPYKAWKQNLRLAGALMLYLISLAPAFLFPQYHLPANTGSHEVACALYTWTDADRLETYADDGSHRKVTFQVFYPADEGSYPLVLFSHGATGMIESNISTCENLASNGYIAVSVGHPYQAIMVQDTSGQVTTIDPEFLNNVLTDNGSDSSEHNRKVYEQSRQWLAVRTGDVNFVLDTILDRHDAGDDIFRMIDTDHIGLFGHSLGGATAVAVGRERSDISAVIDLEGTMFGEYEGYADNQYIYNETPYPVPLLDVNSGWLYEEARNYIGQQYVNFYVGEHAVDFHEAVFENAGHLNYTDLPLVSPILADILGSGSVDPLQCLENVNEMVLDYFNHYLKGIPELSIRDVY